VWTPDQPAKEAALPDVSLYRYEVVVPLRTADDVLRIRVPVEPDGVGATKYVEDSDEQSAVAGG